MDDDMIDASMRTLSVTSSSRTSRIQTSLVEDRRTDLPETLFLNCRAETLTAIVARATGIHPGPGLLACLTQNPVPMGRIRPVILREGNELPRRSQLRAWDASSASALPRR